LISGQIQNVQIMRFIAASQGNITALDELTNTLMDLQVQLQENTRALFLARVEEVNRVAGAATGLAGTRGRIAELQAELGIITGEQAKQVQSQQLAAAAAALIAQGVGLQGLLGEATLRGDEESILTLTQAVEDNKLAQLENTKAMKELDGSLNETQSFTTTAWQWMRTAIFNGSGGLNPQYNMPTVVGTGLSMPSMSVNGVQTANGIGGGMMISGNLLEINEAGQVPDPVYLSNRLALAVKTAGT
jgi:hypothetical protein